MIDGKKECPFCGCDKIYIDDDIGTCVDLGCSDCGIPTISIQISDLMTYEERRNNVFSMDSLSYPREFVDRAVTEAKKRWRTRVKAIPLTDLLAWVEENKFQVSEKSVELLNSSDLKAAVTKMAEGK